MREIAFDTETTGLSPQDGDRIIELGAVEISTGRSFHAYLNPQGREIHPDAEKVHGITLDFLRDKPGFGEIVEDFLAFVGDALLVAHNAAFDMGFLNAELELLNRPAIAQDRVFDTLTLARSRHPGASNSLDALCSRYNIDNSRRSKHGALLDAELLAEVYVEMSGGKQAALGLAAQEASTPQRPALSSGAQEAKEIAQRPSALSPRLSLSALERHRAFVERIGAKAVWKRYRSSSRAE